MADSGVNLVAIVGTGQMGPGIAVAATVAGFDTMLVGRSDDGITRGERAYQTALSFLVDHSAVSAEEASVARGHLTRSTDLAAVARADLVVESIVEDLSTKQSFFAELEEICPPETLISSNTSGLRITDITVRMQRPERAVTTHFWNPGHLMPLVEVIQGERTAEETVQRVFAFLTECGKRPVIGRKDVPGQICNRLFQAVIREAIFIVEQGIASPEGVETAIKAGMGLRFPVWGPLEHIDAAGLDLAVKVQGTVLPSLCRSVEPSQYLQDLVARGDLGQRTGRGFYDWSARSMEDLKEARDLFLVERYKEARRSGKA